MTWPVPKYSRKQVTKAGALLAQKDGQQNLEDLDGWFHAFDVLANWRACHG